MLENMFTDGLCWCARTAAYVRGNFCTQNTTALRGNKKTNFSYRETLVGCRLELPVLLLLHVAVAPAAIRFNVET